MVKKKVSLPQKAGRPKSAKQEAIEYVQQTEDTQDDVTNLVTSEKQENDLIITNENHVTNLVTSEKQENSLIIEGENHVTNLVTSDQKHLEALEKVIDNGLKAFFYEVGHALREIKEKQLYKLQGYDRYEDYCAERWNMSRIHAFRLETASLVIDNLKGYVTNLVTFAPLTESQIRPLTKLEPEQQQQVWEKVMREAPTVQDKPKVTTKLVEEIVSQVIGKEEKKLGQKKSKDKKSAYYRLSVDEEMDDALNEVFYKMRKLVSKEHKGKITKELVIEVMLRVALKELEQSNKDSVIKEVLREIEGKKLDQEDKESDQDGIEL